MMGAWRSRWMAVAVCLTTTLSVSVALASTERASVGSGGLEGNDESELHDISGSGRYVAFASASTNLVPGDGNGLFDVFVHDRNKGETTRISVASDGTEANGESRSPRISRSGRFVAFTSSAANLVPGDTNGAVDVFLHDRKLGTTTRVSVSTTGEQADADAFNPDISDNGRFVAFDSGATNLIPDDTNAVFDAFLHDTKTGVTERVSVGAGVREAALASGLPSVSANGRFVAFTSTDHGLVVGDTNGAADIFVRDRVKDETTRVSVSSSGGQASLPTTSPVISGNGRFVVFGAFSDELSPFDSNNQVDVYVHDRKTAETELVSVSSGGIQGNFGGSILPAAISPNGRFIVFDSISSNLVPGDTNALRDLFLRDTKLRQTTRVSLGDADEQANGFSFFPAVSASGRFVAFGSFATNLVVGDENAIEDVFVRDLKK